MLNKSQQQEAGEGATAIQAGGDANVAIVHHYGLTYSDVREVALDVFSANFYRLAEPAMQLATARAVEITENFLQKLQGENPAGFERGQDPDFQHALFTTQKAYARTGDKDLGDLLVDLLVDRSKQELRDLLQIVLNESLETAPKLTDAQLSALAVVFLFRYTESLVVGNHEQLGNYFDSHVRPFTEKLVKSNACYQHLEFANCGAIQLSEISLEQALGQTYPGLFLKGFDPVEVETRGISIGLDDRFFMPCLNDPAKLQVRANNQKRLQNTLDHFSIGPEDSAKIIALLDVNRMGDHEIRQKCISVRPYMEKVFDTWDDSSMNSFTLTSVGMAIGHANIKRLVGEFASLAIWIN